MSKFFVRASLLLVLILIVGQSHLVKAGDDCPCKKKHHSFHMPSLKSGCCDECESEPDCCGTPMMAAPVPMHAAYPAHATYGLSTSSCGCGSGTPSVFGFANSPIYAAHFGPGFYRANEGGHYRFPYYSYRRPWYYPGPPVYNRNTDLVW